MEKFAGLTKHEATKLLEKFGLNRIDPPKKSNFLKMLYEQFNNFLTILLILAGVISLGIGETVDGSLILMIVLLNALFGIYQEKKAESAIAALAQMTVTKARVIRDGAEIEIDSQQIVPGDILYIEEGTKIPADGAVIKPIAFEVNESALTGESLPVGKKETDVIFMGTIVAKGRAYAKVTETGQRTKFGTIASHLAAVERTATPLQKKLESLSKVLGVVGIIASIVVLALSHFQGSSYLSSFLLAVSLAVAVVPEGLPAVLTITLAIGVKEMAKRNAIVRKLSAVETFGSITLIATDKTGTLTENKMTVKELWVDQKIHDAGVKKNLAGAATSTLTKLVDCGIICSTASLVPVHKASGAHSYDVLGDPTEGALLMLAESDGISYEDVRKSVKVLSEIPFDSVTKLMSVFTDRIAYSKGAPESILGICDRIMIGDKVEKLTPIIVEEIQSAQKAWAKKGLRILAFAENNVDHSKLKSDDLASHIKGSVFLGMVAIHDAPRPEAKEAVARAKSAGIRVVMITGDNEYTAEAIGAHIGIMDPGDEIINGSQLENYSDTELMEKLPKIRIFARTTPFHKSRIVSLFQKSGEVVAVTGDGVNDAIALKKADVGVAMGLVGTDVARETADMVITDDNFATIVNAIEEGRHIIRNVNSAIVYLLSCNIGEAISLIVGLLLGIPHLFYPIQLLYVNLVTDGLPALALAYSPRENNLMRRPPLKSFSLLTKKDYEYIGVIGVIGTVLVLAGYHIFLYEGGNWAKIYAQAAAFSVLVLMQSFIFVDIWFHKKKLIEGLLHLQPAIFYGAFLSPIILQYIILQLPGLSQLFNILPMPTSDYLVIMVISSVVILILGVYRLLKSRNKQ